MIKLPFREDRLVWQDTDARIQAMRHGQYLWEVAIAQTGYRRVRIADGRIDRAHGFGPVLTIQRLLR